MQLFDCRIKIHAEHFFRRRETKLVCKGWPVIGHGYRKTSSGRKLCQCQGHMAAAEDQHAVFLTERLRDPLFCFLLIVKPRNAYLLLKSSLLRQCLRLFWFCAQHI